MSTQGFYIWSKTAGTNATEDSSINWAEGMSPSAVNDSARAMMARAAEFRDDIMGALTTAGTSTAYTITTNQGFDTLAHMGGMSIAFTPHTNNGSPVTLNVDGLGAKSLNSATGVAVPSNTLIQGTPYRATFSNANSEWVLEAFYGNPYNVPIGGFMGFVGLTAPNSSFVLPYGQELSRTTYSVLFGLCGTAYGSGDGSTTFNVPDLRGRVAYFLDNMGGTAASRISLGGRGSTGGSETVTLTKAQVPTGIVSGFSLTDNRSWNAFGVTTGGGTAAAATHAGTASGGSFDVPVQVSGSTEIGFTDNAGGGSHNNLPPGIVTACLLRII